MEHVLLAGELNGFVHTDNRQIVPSAAFGQHLPVGRVDRVSDLRTTTAVRYAADKVHLVAGGLAVCAIHQHPRFWHCSS